MLRYGVFVLLVLMSMGMLIFVCRFELRTKTPIHLFYDCDMGLWHGYIARQECLELRRSDTLLVMQTSVGDVKYIVDGIVQEPAAWHFTLLPIVEEETEDTYREGFIFTGREKIRDMIPLAR